VPSLIQQRMAIDRQRLYARVTLGLGVLWMISTVFTLARWGDSWLVALICSVFVAVLGTAGGAWSYLDARKKLRAFEAEHGIGAGKQKPVR
jgi:hypothetical protein